MPVIGRTAIGLYLYHPPIKELEGLDEAGRLAWACRCGLYIDPPKDK